MREDLARLRIARAAPDGSLNRIARSILLAAALRSPGPLAAEDQLAAGQLAAAIAELGTPPDWGAQAPLVAGAFVAGTDWSFSEATDNNSLLTRSLTGMLVPLASDRSFLGETRLGAALGQALPATTILNAYLERIWLGRGCFGVAAGAQFYFGREPAALSAAEAALLAALERDPFADPERLAARMAAILRGMARASLIDRSEADRLAARGLPDLTLDGDCAPQAAPAP
jgi:Transglycosylase